LVTNTTTAGRGLGREGVMVVLVFLALHLATGALVAGKAAFPTDLDERAHLSFVHQMAARPALIPPYGQMRLIDLAHPARFTDRRNYLVHPSFYYHLMALAVAPGRDSLETEVWRLRLFNLAISGLAVGLFLVIGVRLFADAAQRVAYAGIIALCPKVGVLAGLINNDNLAFLGAAVATFGLLRFWERGPGAGCAAVIGLGFAIGALTKLTAGLLLGFWVLFAHVIAARALWPLDNRRLGHLGVLGVLTLVGVSPYLVNLALYGSPIYMGDFLEATMYRTLAEPLGLGGYGRWYAYLLVSTWATYGADLGDFLSLAAVLGLAAAGVWRSRRPPATEVPAAARLVIAGAVALVLVTVTNFAFAYDLHRTNGLMHAVQFRYYLGLWGAVALAVALAVGALPAGRMRTTAVLVLLGLLYYSHTVPLAGSLIRSL
jgi:hypothetical protein